MRTLVVVALSFSVQVMGLAVVGSLELVAFLVATSPVAGSLTVLAAFSVLPAVLMTLWLSTGWRSRVVRFAGVGCLLVMVLGGLEASTSDDFVEMFDALASFALPEVGVEDPVAFWAAEENRHAQLLAAAAQTRRHGWWLFASSSALGLVALLLGRWLEAPPGGLRVGEGAVGAGTHAGR